MTPNDEEMPDLCAPLDFILRAELAAGNKIGGKEENLWSQIDLVVRLELPFRRTYQVTEDIVFFRNRDAHYSLSDSYSSAQHRQAVEAPY